MSLFRKIFAGGLGWAVGGPIGALLGMAVVSMFENTNVQYQRGANFQQQNTSAGDFSVSLLALSAAVMKADGKVLQSELRYVKTFLRQQFGEDASNQLLQILKKVLEKDIPLRDVCEQIRHNMQHPLRLQLLHYLFGIAKADGRVDKSEVNTIEQIANYLGISSKDFESIKAMFYKNPSSAYKVLEIDPNASDEEVKKAYRKMAVKHHPDKVSNLGEEFQKGAKEKFQKVQESYETIKAERGL